MIAFCADIGQEEELKGLDKKAKATGASKFYALDLVEEFARDFIFPMIQAGAIYENQYYLGTSIARPLIAKAQIEIARKEKADAVAHGATGKGNDQCRFELTDAALAPDLKIIAPWRMPEYRNRFPGRAEMIAYCAEKGIPVEATAKKPYSMDRNLLHISFESGILEDPWAEPPKDMFKLTVAPEDAPDKPEYVTLDFEQGQLRRRQRQDALARQRHADAQQARRQTRHRPRGPGREPFRRHEIARRVRDARRHDPAFRAPPDGDAHDGPRGHAPARLADPAATANWSITASGSAPSAWRCRRS